MRNVVNHIDRYGIMENVTDRVKDMQSGCVVKMDEEEERIKQEEEIKERISSYEESREHITKELIGKEGTEREHVKIRIESCDRLIDGLYDKLNPTKKKEMYK